MKKLLLILLFIPSSLFAEWTTQDTILQSAVIGTIVVDAWQTYTFLHYPNFPNQHETNPILGKHPSNKKFYTYWTSCVILHTSISYLLPKPYRTYWQFIIFGFQINAIHHNYQMGVKLKI